MENYYVYSHIDRDNQLPFYIGVGKGSRALDRNRTDYWKKYVENYANNYEVKYLAKNISQDLAYYIENKFISIFGKVYNGEGILLNWTDGGHGETGFYFELLLDDNFGFENDLTEYGKQLLDIKIENINNKKLKSFLNEICEEKVAELRDKLIMEITKRNKPRKPWIIPFCLTDKVNKRDQIRIRVTDYAELMKLINQPIELENLPKKPYVDFIIHRIMIYFDLILQYNVWVEKNGDRISKSDTNWYFYRDYWEGYTKIIRLMNQGIRLETKYLGRNKKDHNRNDIHDFEVYLVG